jgi:hypothetical protein
MSIICLGYELDDLYFAFDTFMNIIEGINMN